LSLIDELLPRVLSRADYPDPDQECTRVAGLTALRVEQERQSLKYLRGSRSVSGLREPRRRWRHRSWIALLLLLWTLVGVCAWQALDGLP
jgi:hypothetical protein